MTLRPSLPPDANGSVLKFQVFFIDFTLQHISIFGLQSLDIEPKRQLDYLIIVCTGCAIKNGTHSFNQPCSHDRNPCNFKITFICYYTELSFEVYTSQLA